METKKTKNYALFQFHKDNATINTRHLERIVNAIKIKNLLYLRPIVINSDFEVIDGQHRLKAAERLDLPVYYEILEEKNGNKKN